MGACVSVKSVKTRGLVIGRNQQAKQRQKTTGTHAATPADDRVPQQRGRHFKRIPDQYETIEEVTRALRKAGLESCQLIIGVDFTKSNEWTGEVSFGGLCLHSVSGPPNPYQVSLSLIERTLRSFDDDNLIPCYGFGDVHTREHSVFSFFPNNDAARGLNALLEKYRQIAPLVELSGPTSFEPLIRQAMRHVYHMGMRFHLLVILADGQISAAWRQPTMQAIYDASFFPLSIVMIGVGDGPWDEMRTFDNEIPQRRFDNFQFVEYNRVMSNASLSTEDRREASFALQALMELPEQYKIAEGMMGPNAQDRVRPIIAEIPPSVLIDPPMHFNMPSL